MKKFLIVILVINFFCIPIFALELDTSIDDEIRKNYNPSKIEDDMVLPPLPKIRDNMDIKPTKPIPQTKKQNNPVAQTNSLQYVKPTKNSLKESYITLKKGTKIRVKLQNNISDCTKKGTKIKFISEYPVSTTYFTIPMGTVFYGEIMESHKPQLTGNGGLIVINISSIILNNEIQPINAFVTKANRKNIFLNNIKGKRKYISSMVKSTKNGRHFFGKMMRVSGNLATDGSSIVVAPFSFLLGVITVSGNILISPALAVFYKGGSISIPAGTVFEIKLAQDSFIYN